MSILQIAIDTLGGIFGAHFTKSKVLDKYKERRLLKTELQAQKSAEKEAAEADKIQMEIEKELEANTQGAVVPPSPRIESVEVCSVEIDMDTTTKELEVLADEYQNEGSVCLPGNRIISVENKQLQESMNGIAMVLKETNHSLKMIYDRMRDKDKCLEFKEEKAYEWHTVAVAFDRLFFFLYFTTIIILAMVSSAVMFPVLMI